MDTSQEGIALKSVEEPRILGSLWGVGDGVRISGSPKTQLGLTDYRQVRPGSPDCNFGFFFPKCVIWNQSVSFVFVFPARVSLYSSGCPGISSVDLAGFELLEIYLPLPSKRWD